MSRSAKPSYDEAVSFRTPMKVSEYRVYVSGDIFSVCPRCKVCMEYDYQRFCNNCGQALKWRGYPKLKTL